MSRLMITRFLYDITYHLHLSNDTIAGMFDYRDMFGWLMGNFVMSYPTGQVIEIDNSDMTSCDHTFDHYMQVLNDAMNAKYTYQILPGKSSVHRETISLVLSCAISSLRSKYMSYIVKSVMILTAFSIVLITILCLTIFVLQFVYSTVMRFM